MVEHLSVFLLGCYFKRLIYIDEDSIFIQMKLLDVFNVHDKMELQMNKFL